MPRRLSHAIVITTIKAGSRTPSAKKAPALPSAPIIQLKFMKRSPSPR